MMLTKFAVLLVSVALVAADAPPAKIRIRMKGVKRDASHIANYYLPAAASHQHMHHHFGGFSGGAGGSLAGGYGGGSHGAQHLQVLDIKLPQHGGHYIPHYAVPSKSYESTAHHFPIHTPQFAHTGQQYVLSSGHGGNFEELSKALGGGQGAGAGAGGHSFGGASYGGASYGGASFGGASFGGAASSGHGISAGSAAPAYSYASQSFGGAQQQQQQGALFSAQGGYSVGGADASKAGPITFGQQQGQGQVQQQHQQIQQQPQQQQSSSFGGHQFGFVAGAGGHEQQQQAAPQITYLPQAQALTSGASHGISQGQSQSPPVYAVGMKGLGHYATGNSFSGHSLGSSSFGGQGLSFGGGLKGLNLGHSFGGLNLAGLGGGSHGSSLSYGSGAHGNYILDTSALQGLNLGGKFVVMSKPTALTYPAQSYGHSYAQQTPRYTLASPSYSAGQLSSATGGAGGYKTAAPFKPSVFLGATQENVSEYEHGNYGQDDSSAGGASDYSSLTSGGYSSPTAATSYGAAASGHK